MIYAPEYLVGADDDRLLTAVHVVLHLKHTMDPQPISTASLKPQQQDAGSVLL